MKTGINTIASGSMSHWYYLKKYNFAKLSLIFWILSHYASSPFIKWIQHNEFFFFFWSASLSLIARSKINRFSKVVIIFSSIFTSQLYVHIHKHFWDIRNHCHSSITSWFYFLFTIWSRYDHEKKKKFKRIFKADSCNIYSRN